MIIQATYYSASPESMNDLHETLSTLSDVIDAKNVVFDLLPENDEETALLHLASSVYGPELKEGPISIFAILLSDENPN